MEELTALGKMVSKPVASEELTVDSTALTLTTPPTKDSANTKETDKCLALMTTATTETG